MRTRTGLWEPRGGNAPGPPGPKHVSGARITQSDVRHRCALELRHQGHFWSKRRVAVAACPNPTETHHFRFRARAKSRFRAIRSRLVSGRKELFCAS